MLLAGGQASRFPGKLQMPVDGEPMLVRVHRRLTHGGRDCIVSVRTELPPSLAALVSTPVVRDEYDDAGPLGGLVTAAAQVATSLVFAAAGDLPNIDAAFIDDLETEYDRLTESGNAPEAIVPLWVDGKLEPLAALYDRNALVREGRQVLAAGRRRVTAVLEGIRVSTFAVRPQDEPRLANVNTPDDYDALK